MIMDGFKIGLGLAGAFAALWLAGWVLVIMLMCWKQTLWLAGAGMLFLLASWPDAIINGFLIGLSLMGALGALCLACWVLTLMLKVLTLMLRQWKQTMGT